MTLLSANAARWRPQSVRCSVSFNELRTSGLETFALHAPFSLSQNGYGIISFQSINQSNPEFSLLFLLTNTHRTVGWDGTPPSAAWA